MKNLPRLLWVTDRHRCPNQTPLPQIAAEACAAGLRWIQLREKDLDLETYAKLLRQMLAGVAPPPIVSLNSRDPHDVLTTIGGSPLQGFGYHGSAAAPATPVLAPSIRPVGYSAHNPNELADALQRSPDYVIVGTVFPTGCKPGHRGSGWAWLKQAVAQAAPVPVFAIGGITPERAAQAIARGAYGVAVSSGLYPTSPSDTVTDRVLAYQEALGGEIFANSPARSD